MRTESGVSGCWSSLTLNITYTYLQGCHELLERLFTAQRSQAEGQYGLKCSLQINKQSSYPGIGCICQGNGHMDMVSYRLGAAFALMGYQIQNDLRKTCLTSAFLAAHMLGSLRQHPYFNQDSVLVEGELNMPKNSVKSLPSFKFCQMVENITSQHCPRRCSHFRQKTALRNSWGKSGV